MEVALGAPDEPADVAPVVPAEVPEEVVSEGGDVSRGAPSGNGTRTGGDRADVTKGFSSYSPVGHYVPDVVVGEEKQRG